MTWAQLEKLSAEYLQSPSADTAQKIDLCLQGFQTHINTFAAFFVRSHLGMEDATADFLLSADGAFSSTVPCHFDEEKRTFFLNPIGVLSFLEQCRQARQTAKTQQGRESFTMYRYLAYLQELQKLPFKYHFFLCLFRELARVLGITQADKRRNAAVVPLSQPEDDYMAMLWSFKELENAIRHISGIDIRSEHKISWYESEWITVNS